MIDALWVWQVFEKGQWGTIAGEVPGFTGPCPLVFRSPHMADVLAPVAEMHHHRTELPVRLARYELVTVEKEMRAT